MARVYNIRPDILTAVAASYPGNTLVARIPTSLLGNDDGNFTIVGVVGNDHPSDLFPNIGATQVRRSIGTSFTVRSSRSAPVPASSLERAWKPRAKDYRQAR